MRTRGDFSLEQGVHQLTGRLAEVWGIEGRGRIEAGLAADLVVLDPESVGQSAETFHNDVPGGANRYLRSATGIDAVLVAGRPVVEHGNYTDDRPGEIP